MNPTAIAVLTGSARTVLSALLGAALGTMAAALWSAEHKTQTTPQ